MSHYRELCQHGTVLTQCRCPGPKVSRVVRPCPITAHAGWTNPGPASGAGAPETQQATPVDPPGPGEAPGAAEGVAVAAALRALASWSLAAGRTVDDVVVEALLRAREAEGSITSRDRLRQMRQRSEQEGPVSGEHHG